jgi:hypothetical protein
MQFPEDPRLLALGKYYLLRRERRAQIERVQTIAKTLMHLANPLLKDCEEQPPVDGGPLKALQDCIRNAETARTKLIDICGQLAAIRPEAWGE